MNEEIQKFCQAVLDHLDGRRYHEWFNFNHGLCGNIRHYLVGNDEKEIIYHHFKIILFKNYGSSVYPFNKDERGNNNFSDETTRLELYANPKRLEFLHKWASGDFT